MADAEFVKEGFQIVGAQTEPKNFANDHTHFGLENRLPPTEIPKSVSTLDYGYSVKYGNNRES